jgi:hypothetical protein
LTHQLLLRLLQKHSISNRSSSSTISSLQQAQQRNCLQAMVLPARAL